MIVLNHRKEKIVLKLLNILLECLLKWFAPILVFTTEEIFNLINKDGSSIHEYYFLKVPKKWENKQLSDKWEQLFKIKQEANIAIEEKRSSKEIGSSLEAEIKLFLNKDKFDLLRDLDLAEYLITSKAEKVLSEKDGVKIEVKKANGKKCTRCWKILEEKCSRDECPI